MHAAADEVWHSQGQGMVKGIGTFNDNNATESAVA